MHCTLLAVGPGHSSSLVLAGKGQTPGQRVHGFSSYTWTWSGCGGVCSALAAVPPGPVVRPAPFQGAPLAWVWGRGHLVHLCTSSQLLPCVSGELAEVLGASVWWMRVPLLWVPAPVRIHVNHR